MSADPDPSRARLADTASDTLAWGTKAEVKDSLNRLAGTAISYAEEQAKWYNEKKKPYKDKSYWLRIGQIALATIGVFLPVLSVKFADWLTSDKAGVLCFILASGLYGADKFLGYSTAWMRFMKTHLAIDGEIRKFKLAWAERDALRRDAAETIPTAMITADIGVIRDFTLAVHKLVMAETELWITEFQQSLIDLQNLVKARSEAKNGNGSTPAAAAPGASGGGTAGDPASPPPGG